MPTEHEPSFRPLPRLEECELDPRTFDNGEIYCVRADSKINIHRTIEVVPYNRQWALVRDMKSTTAFLMSKKYLSTNYAVVEPEVRTDTNMLSFNPSGLERLKAA